MELSKSSDDQRGSSGGTSNELGKFEDYKEDSEEAPQNPHQEVNQVQPDTNEHIVFNIANTMVANANLDDAPRATATPVTPEHMLIKTPVITKIRNTVHTVGIDSFSMYEHFTHAHCYGG